MDIGGGGYAGKNTTRPMVDVLNCAVDVVELDVAKASAMAQAWGDRITVRCADFRDLQEDESYDLIVTDMNTDAMHWQYEDFMEPVLRLLRPGGYYIPSIIFDLHAAYFAPKARIASAKAPSQHAFLNRFFEAERLSPDMIASRLSENWEFLMLADRFMAPDMSSGIGWVVLRKR